MKKYLFIPFVCLALCCGLTSCGSDDIEDIEKKKEEVKEDEKTEAFITCSFSSFNFNSYSSDSKYCIVKSSSAWHANKVGSFISVDPNMGDAGVTSVKVSVSKASSYRNGSITFINDESKLLRVPLYQRKN